MICFYSFEGCFYQANKVKEQKNGCAGHIWPAGCMLHIPGLDSCHTWQKHLFITRDTVKPLYNDHPRDRKNAGRCWQVVVVQRFKFKMGPQNGDRYRQVVGIRRWSLAQVWLYFDNFSHRYLCTLFKSLPWLTNGNPWLRSNLQNIIILQAINLTLLITNKVSSSKDHIRCRKEWV